MPPRSTGFQAGDLGGATASGVVARAQTPEEALVSPQINRWQYHSKNCDPRCVRVAVFLSPPRYAGHGRCWECPGLPSGPEAGGGSASLTVLVCKTQNGSS